MNLEKTLKIGLLGIGLSISSNNVFSETYNAYSIQNGKLAVRVENLADKENCERLIDGDDKLGIESFCFPSSIKIDNAKAYRNSLRTQKSSKPKSSSITNNDKIISNVSIEGYDDSGRPVYKTSQNLSLPIYNRHNDEPGFLLYKVFNRSGKVLIAAKFRYTPKPHDPDLWCIQSKGYQDEKDGRFSFYCRDSKLGRIDRFGNVPKRGRILHRGASGGIDGKGGDSLDYKIGRDY